MEGEINADFRLRCCRQRVSSQRPACIGGKDRIRTLVYDRLQPLAQKQSSSRSAFIAGPKFTRNQQFINFTGEHSEAKVYGVTMAGGEDLADQTLIVDHAVPHCNSREFFKTVLDGRARGVYQGRINVAPACPEDRRRDDDPGLAACPKTRKWQISLNLKSLLMM